MLRRSSPVQRVLVYATFFTLSLMIHMVLVMPRKTQGEGVAPVASEASAAADQRAASLTPGSSGPQARAGQLGEAR